MLQTVSIIVTGKVQGVFYRQSTKEKALELGITGTVKNQPDGSVLIQASGPSTVINQLIAWCRQGPSRAQVTSVEVTIIETRAFIGFTVLRG
ncbi:acylphosphatase [Paraflavitalea speifideaquila]|uniref:acylphosphatase n=1 Tax=Paraflavitalea speifideaquila TaxID=3076558 RepID=UPI0028E4908F|nr:acylphosphatase [Paraflavitalea speifideiaquila]